METSGLMPGPPEEPGTTKPRRNTLRSSRILTIGSKPNPYDLDSEHKIWAFLSYSPEDNREQRPDKQDVTGLCWGNWLHEALKTFSIPAEFVGQINGRGEIIPERIDPIFRDELEASADGSLSADTRKALEQSICLVVICSPRSAKSQQVNEAVRHFKQLGRGKHILPIVIAGEPNVGEGSKPGRTAEDECFVSAGVATPSGETGWNAGYNPAGG